jgi:hypothetical protein
MGSRHISSFASLLLAFGLALASTGAKSDDTDVLNGVLEGRTYGGLDHFYVSKRDRDLIGERLPLFPWTGGTYVVDRKEDPDQIKCMQDADAGWIIGILKAAIPGTSVPSAVIANTNFGKIPDCNAQWHDQSLQGRCIHAVQHAGGADI